MKKMMVLLAAMLVLSAGSFAQTDQPKKMDTTHRSMKKPMKKKKPMRKTTDSTSMSTDSSANPMK